MRFARLLLLVFASVATAACLAIPGPAAGKLPLELTLGSSGPAVAALQHALVKLGYLPTHSSSGYFDERTWHGVVAFQGWERLPRTGVAGPGTRAALARAGRPRPWGHLTRGLELDLARQVLLVVFHGRTVRAIHISSAQPGMVTPTGSFRVYRRELMSWSVPYQVWMPYALYFTGGYAIHGFGQVPAYPASHGCVRMPMHEAPWVYAVTPLGTPVRIR